MATSQFLFADYVVFILMLAVSGLIGLYYGWKDKNNRTIDQLLLGGRKLRVFPVAMSIMASFTSAVSILGFSVEIYKFGSMYLLIGLSYFVCQPVAAHVFVPFFHRLKITSAYEYLQLRFNYAVRLSASIVFCVEMFLYMSVVLYSPALAVQQVTSIPMWVSIFLTGFVCTVYTSIGGMKAVVLTDTFQVLVMFSGLFAVIFEGTRRIGGFGTIIERMDSSNRIEFFDFNPSPFQRHTFWSLTIGGFFTSLTVYGSNQATIQRYMSLPTVALAQASMYINLIGTILILITCCFCGFVAYAYYYMCDPLADGKIMRHDQILPYLVMELLKDYYGLPGLFIAAVYSAALSTVSSGLNSLTAVFLHDFIHPLHRKIKSREMPEKSSMMFSKLLAASFGLITIGLSFSIQYLGTTVLQISLSIFGILGGPLLGVISLGMFVPFANSYGALVGFYSSIVVNSWLSVGSIINGKKPVAKPFRTDGCESNANQTFTASASAFSSFPNSTLSSSGSEEQLTPSYSPYDISYYWFSLIAIAVVFSLGTLVSLLTKHMEQKEIHSDLLFGYAKKYASQKTRVLPHQDKNTVSGEAGRQNILLNRMSNDVNSQKDIVL